MRLKPGCHDYLDNARYRQRTDDHHRHTFPPPIHLSCRKDDNMKRAYLIIGSFIICASLASCGGSSNGPATLRIQLSPPAPSLPINSSVLVTAQTTPPLPAHMSTMTWSVGNYSTQCTEGTGDPSMAPPMSVPRGVDRVGNHAIRVSARGRVLLLASHARNLSDFRAGTNHE
jgi:hypothetical protein